MPRNSLTLIRIILVMSFLHLPSSLLRADGGTMRWRERVGDYQIAVFTSPTPFRAGPVDVSVLVQDASSGECISEARVTVHLTARGSGFVAEYPATAEAASNKLFHAAVFHLPEPGWWDVDVAVDGPHGSTLIRFGVQADEPLPRWLTLWPWFGWPAFAVALFGIHQVLVRRKDRRSAKYSYLTIPVSQEYSTMLTITQAMK
jgi:hypothetical protein